MKNILSGDVLIKKEEGYANSKGDFVLKFSKKFLDTIEMQKKKGYQLKIAKVNFIVYWLKEGAEKEVKIILPEFYFLKNH